MPLSKDKKILIYLLLFFFLGTINNKYIVEAQIFEIKNFKLEGLNKKEELNLLIQLGQIKNQNIFLLSKKKLVKILNSNNLIESFKINKNYPSNLNISIKKTSFIANVISDKENFIIGANKKLIRSDSIDSSLPMVIGNASVEDFFSIRHDILKSLISFKDIKKLYFFPSKRWDIEFKNEVLVKLPIDNSIEALDNYFRVRNLSQFNNKKVFDMRVTKQIIVNEL